MAKQLLDIRVEREESDSTPEHHVLPAPPASGWASYLPGSLFNEPAPGKRRPTLKTKKSKDKISDIIGFRNPWPSFHKATRQELLQSLEFGADLDPAIDLAASHLPTASRTASIRNQAAELLRSETPDFTFNAHGPDRAKSTWLGHACMLLQLRALTPGSEAQPLRLIFDPIFSPRASPSQYAGPVRSYDPPCKLEDLPPIDAMLLSHNHFDHLDYDTVMALWRLNSAHMRFIVPLKNAQWFVDAGIPADRVTELDWWESAYLTEQGSGGAGGEIGQLKVSCTPAQHSSIRNGDPDAALWAGWYLHHELPQPANSRPYRVFFAGDSGYQFHEAAWPPQAPKATTHQDLEDGLIPKVSDPDHPSSLPPDKYPPCPAYREVAERLGAPDLVYLPIALGATWAYLRSFFSNYLPPSAVPFPRHAAGVAGAIHMPPWDAVRVLRDVTAARREEEETAPPVCVALHWGTFVTEPVEILKTLGLLEWACYNQEVTFGRRLKEADRMVGAMPSFLALNHGQSVVT